MRKIFVLGVAVVLAATLGCGKKSDQTSEQQEQPESSGMAQMAPASVDETDSSAGSTTGSEDMAADEDSSDMDDGQDVVVSTD